MLWEVKICLFCTNSPRFRYTGQPPTAMLSRSHGKPSYGMYAVESKVSVLKHAPRNMLRRIAEKTQRPVFKYHRWEHQHTLAPVRCSPPSVPAAVHARVQVEIYAWQLLQYYSLIVDNKKETQRGRAESRGPSRGIYPYYGRNEVIRRDGTCSLLAIEKLTGVQTSILSGGAVAFKWLAIKAKETEP